MEPEDPWSRVDYRRLIAWPERISREWPFLSAHLETIPIRRVIDLGAGTGEHSRHLAAHGYDVLGVDSSPAMVAKALDAPLSSNLRFIEGDITEIAALVDAAAGAAICLGNTLPHLDEHAMRRLARGLAAALVPGGVFIFQILNYTRIREKKIRSLPLNFLRQPDGHEIVFVRLMTAQADGSVVFTPTTLTYRPEADPPVAVEATRSIRLHGWSWEQLRVLFLDAGFSRVESWGGYDSSAFNPSESHDLVGAITR